MILKHGDEIAAFCGLDKNDYIKSDITLSAQ